MAGAAAAASGVATGGTTSILLSSSEVAASVASGVAGAAAVGTEPEAWGVLLVSGSGSVWSSCCDVSSSVWLSSALVSDASSACAVISD